MENAVKTKNSKIKIWFSLCPTRHILTLCGGIVIVLYFLLRNNAAVMQSICLSFTRPWHSLCSRALSLLPFSMADVLISLGVLAGVTHIIVSIARITRGRVSISAGVYRLVITAVCAFSVIYALFCVLWGVYYYSADFEEQSSLHAEPISTDQLETVAQYFAEKANYYSTLVQRDTDGIFCEDRREIINLSASIYDNAEQLFPCLNGNDICVKPFFFSEIMSYINFTGFFFPFTGEANVNMCSPSCMLPATCAHETAHQRGVAAEDEANFVAVLASMESGNDVYCYSASLLAYIHLGNALYKADREAWERVYCTLNEYVTCDLRAKNAYWSKYETPVSTVSDAVYTGFLQSYGQELGLKSYGACVDLLVAYYYDLAKEG